MADDLYGRLMSLWITTHDRVYKDAADEIKNLRRPCDFVAWDNSEPPQLWAWAGEYGDESSEPLYRLPADGLRAQWDEQQAEVKRLREALEERTLQHSVQHQNALDLTERCQAMETDIREMIREIERWRTHAKAQSGNLTK